MKVLKDNYNKVNVMKETILIKPYPRTCICDNCYSELEYTEADIRMGAWGYMYLDCPCCGHDNILEDNENNITLTMDNIEFPTHFWHTSIDTGAVDFCNNERVKELIHNGIYYLRRNKDEYCWNSQFGNVYICIHKWDGDENYEIVVSNDFYSMEIPFEKEDY